MSDLIADFAELVLGVDEDQALFGGDFGATLEELTGDVFNLHIVTLADESTADDFLAGDVFVVAFFGLGGRGDNGFGEALVFFHAVRDLHAADGVLTALIGAP